MVLGRNEEMIFRELGAISGDMKQTADNMIRDYEERANEAAKRKKELEKTRIMPIPYSPMRIFDKEGLIIDVTFIRDRLNLLLQYLNPPSWEPNITPPRRM